MCRFLSAIVSKNGEVYCDPFIDSHEELIQRFGLRDDQSQFINNIVRVEFTPKDNDYFDVENYTLRVDENSEPDWWMELKESVYNNLKERIKRMVIDKVDNKVLCGGVYFVRDSKILWTRYAKILTLNNSQVNEMWGNSQVNVMWENSQVNVMRGNSQVNVMRENSQVNVMRENSQVNEMWENSQVNVMRENSQVNEMWGNSQVNVMWENSQVNVMWGNSQVNVMRGNSQVNVMWENSQVNVMRGNSQVKNQSDTNKKARGDKTKK